MFMRDFDLPIVHLRYAFPWITPVLRKILLNVSIHAMTIRINYLIKKDVVISEDHFCPNSASD